MKKRSRPKFFKDTNELAKFIDKILDKNDDHPSLYYTGNFYRYFKQVNRSEHGRGANKLNNILECEGKNCYIPLEMDAFSNILSIYHWKRMLSQIYYLHFHKRL